MNVSDNDRNEIMQFSSKSLKSDMTDDYRTYIHKVFTGLGHVYDDDRPESDKGYRGIRTAKFIRDAYEIYCK